MALTSCTECSKDISEKAKTCPHCGAPNAVQSLGAKMHRAVGTAEELVRVADRKVEDINNSPKTKTAIGYYNTTARFVKIVVAVAAVIVLVDLLMPPYGKDRFRTYAKRYSYTLPQCEDTKLIVFDLSAKSPKYYNANTMACLGYIDAMLERFGNQPGNSMDIFTKVSPEYRVAFEGIDEGCNQGGGWGGLGVLDIEASWPKSEWGGMVNTYDDGARVFAMDVLTGTHRTEHIKGNLLRCETKLESWENYSAVDYYLAKIGLPPL